MLMPKKSEKVKNIRKLEMPAAARASAPSRPASAVLIMNRALCIRFSSMAGQPSANRRRRIWGRGSWGWPETGGEATARADGNGLLPSFEMVKATYADSTAGRGGWGSFGW